MKFLRRALLIEPDAIIFCYRSISSNSTVTYRPIARQRLGKHIPTGVNARNNRTSIANQRISRHASLTIERLYFLHGPCKVVINVQKRSFEVVVRS
jgi:hypothetical protein